MRGLLTRFARDRASANAIEYGLIASLLAIVLIAGATTLGNKLTETFDVIAEKVELDASNAFALEAVRAGDRQR
jgi:pilus assembly protein Flp/PilA